jgi:PBP superfamily domain
MLGALVASCLVVFAGSSVSAPAETAAVPLQGGGSWGAYREVLKWQDDLSGSKSPIDLSYTAHGSFIGRQEFISGSNDFVMSGVPFTAEELAQVPGGAAGLIDAPVQVSTLGFLLQAPVPDGFATLEQLCDPDDPTVPDPSACLVKHPYTGPIKLPATNLAAMALHYTGTGFPPQNSWNDPNVLAAMGVANFTTPPLAGPGPVNRSDPDETSYFLQQFVAAKAPDVWNGLKASNPTIPWEPITERLGRQGGASRDGVDQQSQQLALGGGDPTSGTLTQFTAGVFAPVPPSAVGGIKQTFPDAKVQFVQVQNANGDWVEPTPDSINKAVDAGGGTPLYALTNAVPGAYPFVWIDHLYAPAHGLTIEKTETLATLIRYLATAGQAAAKPVGEGELSQPLVKQALVAANQLVKSNCTGNDRHIEESSDAGSFAPDLPAMDSIGTMSHCVSGGTGGSTTSDDLSGGSSSFDSQSFSSGVSSSDSTAAPVTESATTTVDGVEVKRSASGALIASQLPLSSPATTGGVDRLATLLLGVALFFVLRRPVKKLLARRAE